MTGSIVPKTLFGEKYVSLIVPPEASATAIAVGDVIERTELSTEVEQVLSDLYPLLRAVQPADLNMTLNAIATALEGRGDQLGENLETLDGYLTRLQPRDPRARRGPAADRRGVRHLRRRAARGRHDPAQHDHHDQTLEGREEKLKALFNDMTKLATVAERFLGDNGDNLIRLGDLCRPARALRPLRPRVPLPARGHRRRGQAAGRGVPRLHAPHRAGDAAQPAARLRAADTPGVRRQARPPLRRVADPPWSQSNPLTYQPDFADGIDEPTGKGTSRVGPGWSGTSAGYAGGRDEESLLKALLGPGLGVSADDVPDLGVLLVGPMARGAKVSLR